MFAGHVGAGLALGALGPRINAGVLVASALLADIVLWACVLAGWESVAFPEDYLLTRQPAFVFPFSHGLIAGLLWSAVAALVVWGTWPRLAPQRAGAAAVVAAAVFSHWLLDALVHRAELPVAGAGSAKLGLGLWDRLPVALGVEAVLVLLGAILFLRRTRASRARAIGGVVTSLALLAFTVVGMTMSPQPPSATAMAASSLVTIAIVGVLYGWLDAAGGQSATKPFQVFR